MTGKALKCHPEWSSQWCPAGVGEDAARWSDKTANVCELCEGKPCKDAARVRENTYGTKSDADLTQDGGVQTNVQLELQDNDNFFTRAVTQYIYKHAALWVFQYDRFGRIKDAHVTFEKRFIAWITV